MGVNWIFYLFLKVVYIVSPYNINYLEATVIVIQHCINKMELNY